MFDGVYICKHTLDGIYLIKPAIFSRRLSGLLLVESVEKVARADIWWVWGKKDLTDIPTADDLRLRRGQVTPENLVLTLQMGFSYRLVRRHQYLPKRVESTFNLRAHRDKAK